MGKKETKQQDNQVWLFIALSLIIFPLWFNFILKSPKGARIIPGSESDVLLSLLFTLLFIMFITFCVGRFIKGLPQNRERGLIKELCIMAHNYNDFFAGKKVAGYLRKVKPDEKNIIDLSNDFKYEEINIEEESSGLYYIIQLKNTKTEK